MLSQKYSVQVTKIAKVEIETLSDVQNSGNKTGCQRQMRKHSKGFVQNNPSLNWQAKGRIRYKATEDDGTTGLSLYAYIFSKQYLCE